MKIQNFINLKSNGKSIDFHNMILDEYLERFVTTQLDVKQNNYGRQWKRLNSVFLKFDTVLNFEATSRINTNTEFDALINSPTLTSQSISEKKNEVKYIFNSVKDLVDLSTHTTVDVSYFYGRKITAIGFNAIPGSPQLAGYACAILDTSKYNISLEENQEFVLTRRDIINSDANFWSNSDKIKGPIHLTVEGGPSLLYQDRLEETDEGGTTHFVTPANTFAQLYSVGFSSYKDFIAKEFVLGEDATAINNGTSISIKGIENYLAQYSYPPLNEIFAGTGIHPLKSNYKYVIFKYKIYQEIYTQNPDYIEGGDNPRYIGTWTDTKCYYNQSIPITKFGKNDLSIKYERSN